MKPRICYALAFLAVGFIGSLNTTSIWAQSQARAIRLSFVEGDVTVQRADVQGWAEAPVNTPIQEGSQISTGERSYAEVQFENGGTVRLGERGLLEFTQLALAPGGGKIDRVDLRQGYATFHMLPSQLGESFEVGTPYGAFVAEPGTKFRVDIEEGVGRVEVFDGQVELHADHGGMTLGRDSVLTLQPGLSETEVTQGITADDWDQWVDDRDSHLETAASAPPSDDGADAAETRYGWNDLQEYGTWSDVPGMGYGWSPAVSAGWAPYSSGQWCWYPTWGYTWIGAEPWGWLPYHYGGWEFVPGRGWIWFPGHFRTWSPGRVTWFHGDGWVGWTPRPHRPGVTPACGEHCGGGVVSAATFRQGGLLTSSRMLGFRPTTGQPVKAPGIMPTAAAKLPGSAVSFPAAQGHGLNRGGAHVPATTEAAASATSAAGSRPAESPDSGIVYDPQEGRYINGRRVAPTQRPTGAPPGAGVSRDQTTSPSGPPAAAEAGRGQQARSADNPQSNQPNPAMGTGQRSLIRAWPASGAAPRANPNANTYTPSPQPVTPPNAPKAVGIRPEGERGRPAGGGAGLGGRFAGEPTAGPRTGAASAAPSAGPASSGSTHAGNAMAGGGASPSVHSSPAPAPSAAPAATPAGGRH